MRAFAAFFGLLLLGCAGIAALSYPAWLLVSPHFDFAFHRVATRIGMLIVLVGFVLTARHLKLSNRVALGYDLPARRFWQELARNLLLGVVTMLPVIGMMLWLQLRSRRPEFVFDPGSVAQLARQGLVTGLAVAFIEETFFRGAMFAGIRRDAGALSAIVLTSIVFAALHFVGRYHIDKALVGPGSGLELLAGTFAELGHPAHIADAYLSLFAVGALLGAAREVTGNIAACIGLHAGWVWVISVAGELTVPNTNSPMIWMVSQYDHVVGWLVLAWTIVMGAWLLRHLRGRRAFSPTGP